MSQQTRCHCRSCTIRSLMGSAIVITIGVLFLLHQTHGGRLFFGNTFPVILLVIGAIQIASALAPRVGHVEPPAPVAFQPPPQPPQPPMAPPAGTPMAPASPSAPSTTATAQTPYSAQEQ
jgi:hypothetical protein